MQVLRETLELALSMQRPYGGEGVAWLRDHLLTIPGAVADAAGNVHVEVVSPHPSAVRSATLFCSHIDTVHANDGGNRYTTRPDTDGKTVNGIRSYRAQESCLGADCAAGVALMASMIDAGVPGYYLFHDGEEPGCFGSHHVAADVGFLSRFRRAVAFDRKGSKSIVTHQSGIQTASLAFAQALSKQLAAQGLDLQADDGGTHTDSLQYRRIIPECTNLSVGYHFAHSPKEWLDMVFLERMTAACSQVRWEGLPVGCKEPLWDADEECEWAA